MGERYIQLYRQEDMLYSVGSPVIISAGALLSDTISGKLLVQLKLQSISAVPLRSVTVCILPVCAEGGENTAVVEYEYKDLDMRRGECFGTNTAIIIKQSSVVSYKVRVKDAEFANGKHWVGDMKCFEALPPIRTLKEAYSSQDVWELFCTKYSKPDFPCIYLPEKHKDLWYCTCGEINLACEVSCPNCRRTQNALLSIDEKQLEDETKHRAVNVVPAAEITEEDTAENHSKLKKLILILLPIVLVLSLVLATVPPYLRQKNDYAKAVAMLEAGKYDQAERALTALGDYNDCAELVQKEIPYRKAVYVIKCAENGSPDGLVMLGLKRTEIDTSESVSSVLYRKAIEMFTQLGDYRDSSEYIVKAQKALSDYSDALVIGKYNEAMNLLNEKQFCMARDAFEALGDYKDCIAMAQECIYMKADSLLSLTGKYSMEGISCKISTESGEDSLFYAPMDVLQSKGADFLAELRDCCGDSSKTEFAEAPAGSDCIPYCDAVAAVFDSLGSYKDSADKATAARKAGDYTAPFYALCAKGDLNGALQWVESFKGTLPGKDDLVNIINSYLPYCGMWSFRQGDPALLSSVLGLNVSCDGIITTVKLSMDAPAMLHVALNGNEDASFDLQADTTIANGSMRFAVSPDGMNVYYIVLDDAGRLCGSKYITNSTDSNTYSCVYSRIG